MPPPHSRPPPPPILITLSPPANTQIQLQLLAIHKHHPLLFIHTPQTDRRHDHWITHENIQHAHSKNTLCALRTQIERYDTQYEKYVRAAEEERKIAKEKEEKGESRGNTYGEAMETMERERIFATRIKYITSVVVNGYMCDTWYYAPYPEGYQVQNIRKQSRCKKKAEKQSSRLHSQDLKMLIGGNFIRM